MKGRAGEEVNYSINQWSEFPLQDKVIWNTLAQQYPISPEYTEVEYIQSWGGMTGGGIVIEDIAIGRMVNIGVNLRFYTALNEVWCIVGCGSWTGSTGDTVGYDLGLWRMKDGNNVFFTTCCGPNMRAVGAPNNQYCLADMDIGTVYNAVIEYTAIDSTTSKARFVIREDGEYLYKFGEVNHPGATVKQSSLIAPLGFMGMPCRSETTNPQYYGFAYQSFPDANGTIGANSYTSNGARIYSRIRIYNTVTHAPIKFLYTCFKKSTHQYGLYDAVNDIFYPGWYERQSGVWSNSNYYYEHMATASGDTRIDKEKTFLKICGPNV